MTDDIIIEAVCFDLRGYTIINIDFILINVPYIIICTNIVIHQKV